MKIGVTQNIPAVFNRLMPDIQLNVLPSIGMLENTLMIGQF